MAFYFDPYREWLGLHFEGRPSYYELLGLDEFERDASAISLAYALRSKLVRPHQRGEHAGAATEVLGNLNTAFNCLRDPKTKARYDTKLRKRAKRNQAASEVQEVRTTSAEVVGMPAQPSTSTAYRRKTRGSPEQLVIVAAVALFLFVGMVVLISQTSRTPPIADRRPVDRTVAAKEDGHDVVRSRPRPDTQPSVEAIPSREFAPTKIDEPAAESPETSKRVLLPEQPVPAVESGEFSGKQTVTPTSVVSDAVSPTPAKVELRRFEGETTGVHGIVFNADGSQVLTVGQDKSIRVWNAATGRETRAISGHADVVHSVAISSDGKLILSGSSDGTVRTWDATGKPLHMLKGHAGAVSGVAISASGDQAASAGHDKTVRLWDLQSGREIRHLDGPASWTCVAFAPDGRYVLCGGWNGTLSVWDAGSGKELHRLGAHDDSIHTVLCFPDNQRAITGCWDGTVCIWDIRSGQQVGNLGVASEPVCALAVSADGRRVATGSEDGSIRLWGSRTREPLGFLAGHTNRVRCLAFSPDGTRLVSSALDETIRLWDLRIPIHATLEGGKPNRRKLSVE